MFLKKEFEDFLIIGNYLNISKAADFLGVQQSGLSKSIQKVESGVGFKVFIRASRGLRFTPQGKALFNGITSNRQQLSNLLDEIKNENDEPIGNFTISVHPVIGRFIIPKILSKIDKYSKIKLEFKFETSRMGTELVSNNQIDLAIAAAPLSSPNLVVKKIWKEHIGLYSKDGKIKNKLLYNSNMIDAQKIIRKIAAPSVQEINNYDILYSTLKRSDYMGLLPNPVAQRENKLKTIKSFKPSIEICYVYHAERNKNKAFNILINSIKELAETKSLLA